MIQNVTDTALWIAAYRAEESNRKDALFRDPYAKMLLGDEGHLIARRTQGSRYTAWSVIIRTYIIDRFINELIIKDNIDTVLNLGAGLDTRPYRLNLPSKLKWIEVDYENIINLKNEKLKDLKPNCQLERKTLDLSKQLERNIFFQSVSSESKNVLILTEGVIPYLTNNDAESLAKSLYAHEHFNYWITEYYSPEILNFLRTPKRLKQMENAPFLFYPEHWIDFFKAVGWQEDKIEYFGVESEKIGRTPPTPGWLKNTTSQTMENELDSIKYYLGYILFEKNK